MNTDNKNLSPVYSLGELEESETYLNTKKISFEYLSDDHDGIFPRVSDWTRFTNKLENEGITSFLNWYGKRKLKFNSYSCTVKREDKYSNKATIYFDNPIKVSFGEVNDEPIIKEVTEITGYFNFEWFWLKNGKQNKIANIVEIYFNCETYK